MRAIDADALVEILTTAIRNMQGVAKFIGAEDDPEIKMEIKAYTDILEGVKEQPTIEERKRGKWIERNPQNSDTCRLIECDQCGFSHIVGFNVPYEHWIENRNFCERCGADMREGQE